MIQLIIVINKLSQREYKEKSSKFITYLFKVESLEEYEEVFSLVKEEHKKASHILRLSIFPNKYGVSIEQVSEDKEPISSMKRLKEIAKINSYDNFALFIVRYFGGTKLGASNLDRFYFDIGVKELSKLKES